MRRPRQRHSHSGRLPGRPPTGRALTAAERMRRYRARQRAAGLRPVIRMEARVPAVSAGLLTHRVLEARSLAMHCLAAQKVERNPALLNGVRRRLAAWRSRYATQVPRALDEWKAMLDRSWPEIAAFITDPGERAVRLRQSTPFAGVLSASERKRVYAAFRP
ncbi:MAG: hypothetical protein HY525_14135 [Betaproteobacteria bacterium]|nr:hypothetical protein [Betaproteobacteria bacterium]